MRAISGHCAMAITKVMTGMDEPNNATTSSSIIRSGSESCASRRRLTTASTQPPRYPASEPRVRPMSPDTTTARTPMVSETWPPKRTRASRSRPSWSVPKRCPSVSGESRRAPRSVASGDGSGSTRANATGRITTSAQMLPTQIFRRLSRARRVTPARAMSLAVTALGRMRSVSSVTVVISSYPFPAGPAGPEADSRDRRAAGPGSPGPR